MISDQNGEIDSQSVRTNLPSLMALRCFEAAAHENFSRAADELCLTHGAVSRAVRLLEDDLGVALFQRRSRRVFLTDAGRKLAQAVHDGLGLMRHAAQECVPRPPGAALGAVVRTDASDALADSALAGFSGAACGVDIHLAAAGGPFSFDSGIDMAIRRNDFAWPAGYHAERLFAEKVGPVCRPDKVDAWFSARRGSRSLKADVARLHTRTRPHAWKEWAVAANQPAAGEARADVRPFLFQSAGGGCGSRCCHRPVESRSRRHRKRCARRTDGVRRGWFGLLLVDAGTGGGGECAGDVLGWLRAVV